jgi:class 3 adenylate cyclase
MSSLPEDPRLAEWVKWLEPTRWPALICDSKWRLVWVSDELKAFLRESDEQKLGYGRHLAQAFFGDSWRSTITLDSQVRLFTELIPYVLGDSDTAALLERLEEPFASLTAGLTPKAPPFLFSSWFDYIPSDGDPYRVDLVCTRVLDENGDVVGAWAVTYMAVRPNLVSLLARGDEAMYERMAKLVEPGRRQAAIMFADLESSGTLSRQMPSAAYFRVVRDLTTAIDRVVAKHLGVTGKHAGDGITAYFLVDDLGSPSRAGAAAVRAALEIRDLARDLFEGVVADTDELQDPGGLMNIGLHWGGTLYMGQLVPGGRLDVTALGDEVNECARIQESARGATILASKALLEQLTDDDAAAASIDPEKVTYQPLAQWPTVTEKAVRDAGGIAVTKL